jgi:hypothetical protein
MVTGSSVSNTALMTCRASFLAPWGWNARLAQGRAAYDFEGIELHKLEEVGGFLVGGLESIALHSDGQRFG